MITDGRLSHLIFIAYDLHSIGQIKNAPDWVIAGTERFTVEAKAEDPSKATQAQLLEMLRSLLQERFKLKFHRDNQEVPGFGLTVAKNGPKLQEAKSDEVATNFSDALKPSEAGPITFTARKYSMERITDMIRDSRLARWWIRPDSRARTTSSCPGMRLRVRLFLRRCRNSWDFGSNPQKVPVSFFIFESAQRPTGN